MGLSPERLFPHNPSLIWITITAYGWGGEKGMRIGFGDDAAAVAGGLVDLPGLIRTRGDRYRALVPPEDEPDLYRCASLIAAGLPLGGGSDAPYGDLDP